MIFIYHRNVNTISQTKLLSRQLPNIMSMLVNALSKTEDIGAAQFTDEELRPVLLIY